MNHHSYPKVFLFPTLTIWETLYTTTTNANKCFGELLAVLYGLQHLATNLPFWCLLITSDNTSLVNYKRNKILRYSRSLSYCTVGTNRTTFRYKRSESKGRSPLIIQVQHLFKCGTNPIICLSLHREHNWNRSSLHSHLFSEPGEWFSQTLSGLAYTFPTTSLITRVLQKIQLTKRISYQFLLAGNALVSTRLKTLSGSSESVTSTSRLAIITTGSSTSSHQKKGTSASLETVMLLLSSQGF